MEMIEMLNTEDMLYISGIVTIGFIIVYQYNKLYSAYNKLQQEYEETHYKKFFLDMIDNMNDDMIHEILLKCSKNTFIPNWYDKKYFEKVVNWGENISNTRWSKVCSDDNTSYNELIDELDTMIVRWYINNYNPTLKEYPTTTESDSESDSNESNSSESSETVSDSDSDSDYVPSEAESDSDKEKK
jgi:hypothetical protein